MVFGLFRLCYSFALMLWFIGACGLLGCWWLLLAYGCFRYDTGCGLRAADGVGLLIIFVRVVVLFLFRGLFGCCLLRFIVVLLRCLLPFGGWLLVVWLNCGVNSVDWSFVLYVFCVCLLVDICMCGLGILVVCFVCWFWFRFVVWLFALVISACFAVSVR